MNATHSEKRKNTEGVKRGQQSNEIKMAINVITKCTKKSCLPTSSGERLIRGYTKFDFTVDEERNGCHIGSRTQPRQEDKAKDNE